MSCADRNTSRPCAQSRLTARSLHRKCISGGSQPTGHPVLSPTFDVCGKTACGSGGLNLPSDSGCALMQRALHSLRASPRLLPTEPSWPPRCSRIIATAHTQRNIVHGTYVRKDYVPYKNPKALKPRQEAGFCSLRQHERGPREHRRRSAPSSQRKHAEQDVSAPLSFPRSLSRAATCRYVASTLALLQQPWSNHTCEHTHPSTLAWASSGEAPHPPSPLGVVLGPLQTQIARPHLLLPIRSTLAAAGSCRRQRKRAAQTTRVRVAPRGHRRKRKRQLTASTRKRASRRMLPKATAAAAARWSALMNRESP